VVIQFSEWLHFMKVAGGRLSFLVAADAGEGSARDDKLKLPAEVALPGGKLEPSRAPKSYALVLMSEHSRLVPIFSGGQRG